MAPQRAVLPLRRREREPLQRCESCRRHRRCRLVHVEGVEFIVCDSCAELATFDTAGDAA